MISTGDAPQGDAGPEQRDADLLLVGHTGKRGVLVGCASLFAPFWCVGNSLPPFEFCLSSQKKHCHKRLTNEAV
jgi:hypothetical protein